MKSTMSLQVDTDTLLKLIGQLRIRGGSQDLSEAINSAIERSYGENNYARVEGARRNGARADSGTANASANVRASCASRAARSNAGVDWDQPERRKFRFRLEDVAFD
jgi:hypothetical protein